MRIQHATMWQGHAAVKYAHVYAVRCSAAVHTCTRMNMTVLERCRTAAHQRMVLAALQAAMAHHVQKYLYSFLLHHYHCCLTVHIQHCSDLRQRPVCQIDCNTVYHIFGVSCPLPMLMLPQTAGMCARPLHSPVIPSHTADSSIPLCQQQMSGDHTGTTRSKACCVNHAAAQLHYAVTCTAFSTLSISPVMPDQEQTPQQNNPSQG